MLSRIGYYLGLVPRTRLEEEFLLQADRIAQDYHSLRTRPLPRTVRYSAWFLLLTVIFTLVLAWVVLAQFLDVAVAVELDYPVDPATMQDTELPQ